MESHYGRAGVRLGALLGISLTILLLVACSRSEFERQHQQAVLENPAGVELEIRTRDGRRYFAASEPVPYEEIYTSKVLGQWHVEILDGWNEAAESEVFHIADGEAISDKGWMYGFICCDSRHIWLSPDSVRLPYKLLAGGRSNPEHSTNPEWYTLQLPSKPGKYLVYVTTRRVFGGSDTITTYRGRGIPVASNILHLEVK